MGKSFKDNLIKLDKCQSTNDEAFKIAEKCAVIANSQSGGRGRNGHFFVSNSADGLWLSLLEKDVLSPEITAWTATIVCHILQSFGLNTKIKWPNDILINNKKICGILCEMRNNSVVIGIGINLYQNDFGDLNEIAISAAQCAVHIDKEDLLDQLLDALDTMLKDFPSKRQEYLKYYKNNSAILGKEINCENKTVIAKDFTDKFELVIEDADETRIINAGEISIRIK